MTIKAYSYIRFSSFRQADGDSIRRQTELARKYATKNDLDLQDANISDYGISAFRGDNAATGALGAFIKLVENGEIKKGSYLLVENFDRLSRDRVRNALSLLLNLIDLGIVVVTLADEKIYCDNSLDDMSLLMSIMIMSRAHEESQMKSRRTKAVWDQRKETARLDGKFITNSNYPRWLVREGDNLILPSENKAIIQQVFKWSIDGYGYQKIADMLNEKNHFTFHKNKLWVAGNIQALLRNKSVIGQYQPHIKEDGKRIKHGDPIKNYYPLVITPAVFLEAQVAIDNRNKRGSGYRKGTFMNLFTGLVRCSNCSKSVVLGSMYKGSGAAYLKCSAGCKGRLRYQYIEPQMLTALGQLKRVTDKYKKPTSNELAAIQLEVISLDIKLVELSNLLVKHPSEAIAKGLQNTENRLKELKDSEAKILAENAANAVRGSIVLGNEDLEGAEARGIFNSKLKAVLDYIELNILDNTMVYFADGQPVLEQRITRSNKKMQTRIYEMDGHLVGCTDKDKPLQLILDERDDVPDFSSVINENEELNIIEEISIDGIPKKVTSNYSV